MDDYNAPACIIIGMRRVPPSVFCLLLTLLLIVTSCSTPSPAPSDTGAASLYVHRESPPALLQISADLTTVEREVPLDLPRVCQLYGLYAPAGGDARAAELTCPNGPVTLLVQPEGGATWLLLQDNAIDSHFLAWAADGGSLYLRVNSMADPHVLRVDIHSLQATDLSIDAYTYDLAAAPDGRHILFSFSHGMGLGSEMWLADANGRGGKQLLSDPENILAFARWSPDGRRLAFIKIPDSQTPYSAGELWVAEADGSNARKWAEADAGHGYAASWSPDSTRLAFVVRANPEDPSADQSFEALISNIALVDISSRAVMQVTHFTRGRAETPAWSPDGNTLSFAFVLDGRMDVQIADLADGTRASLPGESVCCPVWMWK